MTSAKMNQTETSGGGTNADKIEFHKIAAHGNVTLVAKRPQKAFAIWDPAEDYPRLLDTAGNESTLLTRPEALELSCNNSEERVLKSTIGSAFVDVHGPECECESRSDHEDSSKVEPGNGAQTAEVRFQVSSAHLIQASRYFEAMLTNNAWMEKERLQTEGSIRLSVDDDWDPDALLIVMNIVHGNNGAVVRSVSLETLAKIAVIVDFYGCHESMEVFVEIWIQDLEGPLSKAYDRDLLLKMCVSSVFQKRSTLESLGRVAAFHIRGPIRTLGLPISSFIIGNLCTYGMFGCSNQRWFRAN